MGVYHCLDFIATLTEMFGLYLFGICFCKKPRFRSFVNKWIIMGGYFLSVYVMTWHTELGGYKMPLVAVIGIVLLKICYRDSVLQCVVSYEMFWIAASIMSENIGIFGGHLIYGEDILVLIEGRSLIRWEIYIITLIIRIFTVFVFYKICRGFNCRLNSKDFCVVTAIFAISFFVTAMSVVMNLNLHETTDFLFNIVMVVLPGVFMLIFLYVKNTAYLRKQDQQKQMTIERMNQQFAYYQGKLKDEEKVRSIYHDMKNHLLVLQRQINSPETAEMIEKLQSQVAMYEDYVHTGNDILDIILKEKSELARETHIALSVTVALNDIDFIEPLDISTIFGNGLDNAIEASKKLPEEQRAILVKAGKIHNFFFVLIENNCLRESGNIKSRTTKNNDFFHGFGISNMQKATEKYGGQLTTKCKSGKFTLKILVPIP